ncbi:MAG: SH3 domain-containing protein, partial [Anaerolineae bacterium]|nr:SH3 domain-containing protein [Anaerolineae bacterium]
PGAPEGTGPCQVAFTGPVNVRTGPSLAHPIIGAGQPGQVFTVTGRNFDASWWQVNHASGQTGWLSSQIDAVTTQGDCSAVPQANFPPAPTATYTPTPAPTFTPTSTPTPMVSPTPTFTPTFTPTNPPVATLNFSLPPSHGATSRTSGFVPDPVAVGMTGGGPVNVSYLGGGCSGYTTSAPNLRVNYTAGAFPLLRFYFIGNVDSTMVINTPGGSYICVDDSFGTLHPTIDFNNPASGAYDIWIGSFSPDGTVSGTLYMTENSGNHP